MDAVPPGIDPAAVTAFLLSQPDVAGVHDLHIWALGTTETALTAHLVRPGATLDDAFLVDVEAGLRTRFGIAHSTLQLEVGHECAACPLPAGKVGA